MIALPMAVCDSIFQMTGIKPYVCFMKYLGSLF